MQRLTGWTVTVVLLGVAMASLGGCTDQGAAWRPVGHAALGPDRELLVNQRPLLPLMGFYQSVKSFEHAEVMGLNGYFMPGKTPAREYLDALAARKLYGIVLYDPEVTGHAALLAWLQPHEPDALAEGKPRSTPDEVVAAYEAIRKADPSRPVVLDFSPNFMLKAEFAEGRSEQQKREDYAAYARGGDILTYNVYPIWLHNRPERINWVAEAADDLREIVGPDKPFFAMIETGKGSKAVPVDEQRDVSVDEIRAEVWMALTHGATGIIYFTHQFKPSFTEFAPDADKQAGIKAINAQITRLAPILLSGATQRPVVVAFVGGLEASWTAREYKGRLYLFVLNADPQRREGKISIAAEGLRAGQTVEVIDEGRTIKVDRDGSFSDTFGPLGLHIYAMDVAGK
ncbi:MAG: beta-galactosidase [Planctomycetes bacterium]|nr:beta-galactosidase [Planctomycetota bacterium]